MQTKIKVQGFHCKSCEMLVKDVASDFPQIQSCSVDVNTGQVTIEHASSLDLAKFKKEIEELGEYKIVS